MYFWYKLSFLCFFLFFLIKVIKPKSKERSFDANKPVVTAFKGIPLSLLLVVKYCRLVSFEHKTIHTIQYFHSPLFVLYRGKSRYIGGRDIEKSL